MCLKSLFLVVSQKCQKVSKRPAFKAGFDKKSDENDTNKTPLETPLKTPPVTPLKTPPVTPLRTPVRPGVAPVRPGVAPVRFRKNTVKLGSEAARTRTTGWCSGSTVPVLHHYPGYHYPVHPPPPPARHVRGRVQRSDTVHQASFGYSHWVKIPTCPKLPLFNDQKGPVKNDTFCTKSLPNPHSFWQKCHFCHFCWKTLILVIFWRHHWFMRFFTVSGLSGFLMGKVQKVQNDKKNSENHEISHFSLKCHRQTWHSRNPTFRPLFRLKTVIFVKSP